MGQILSCFRERCGYFKDHERVPTTSDGSPPRNSLSTRSSATSAQPVEHSVILIEEQDDPGQIIPQVRLQSSSRPEHRNVDAVDTTASRLPRIRSRSPSPTLSCKKGKYDSPEREQYLDFPILNDPTTKKFICKSKVSALNYFKPCIVHIF